MDLDAHDLLAAARIGERWVIRHRLPDGSATDVIGWINTSDASTLDLLVRSGEPARRVDAQTIIAARRLSPAARGRDPLRTSAAELQRIALPGWVAEHEPLGDWTLRAAGGFTGRANSCLAVGDAGVPYAVAAARIRSYAEEHGITPRAQVVVGSEQDQGLRALGWASSYVTTEVLVTRLADLLEGTLPDPAISVSEELTDRWLAGYQESRPNTADPQLLRRILDGQPPRAFAAASTVGSLRAIGRGHVRADWLGLASIWTRPELRRRGLGREITVALGHWAARLGARNVYLQVAAENRTAITAYERLGFRRHHGYGYLSPGVGVASSGRDA